MSENDPVEQISAYLRQGQARKAVEVARKIAEASGNSKEAGISIAKAAAAVYRDLIAPPVHEFAELAPQEIGGDAGPLVQKALNRLIKMTEEWEQSLWAVHTERLVREIRDWTRARHFDAVLSNIHRLMALVPEDRRRQRAAFIGSAMATVINNQREAQDILRKLAQSPDQWGVTRDEVAEMDRIRQQRFERIGQMNLDMIEREFSSTLTEAIVKIQNALPDSGKMGEPDEAILRDTGDMFRSVLRVPIWRQEPDLFLDATKILVDFIPKEQSPQPGWPRWRGASTAASAIRPRRRFF